MTERQSLKIPEISQSHIGKTIKTFGWVESIRSAGRAGTFIDLFYGCKTLKCLVQNDILQKAVDLYEKEKKPQINDGTNENGHISDGIQKDEQIAGTTGKCPKMQHDSLAIENLKIAENQKYKKDATKTSKQQLSKTATCSNLVPHSSVYITAEIKENYSKKDQDRHKIEAHITEIKIYRIAPSFPINNESSLHTKLQLGHLNLRTKDRILFLQARSELMHLFREFYYHNNYFEVTPPTLVLTQVEGGSTLFALDYYGSKAYLTQSSQLYLETVSPSVGKVFCIMPSYRAEKFNTTRHLSEYTHIEGEISYTSFEELLSEIEKMVKYVISNFLKKMREKILLNYPNFDFDIFQKITAKSFKVMTYSEAIDTLIAQNIFKDKENNIPYKYGDDISDRDEVSLVAFFENSPIFLTKFPMEHKPFYCRKSDQIDNKILNNKNEHNLSGVVTESVDLLWPGIGEILGGSMRCESYEELLEGFTREGIDTKDYYWYLDLRLFNADVHGGYGLGFERLLKAIMGYQNVNEACLYPRFPGRCEP